MFFLQFEARLARAVGLQCRFLQCVCESGPVQFLLLFAFGRLFLLLVELLKIGYNLTSSVYDDIRWIIQVLSGSSLNIIYHLPDMIGIWHAPHSLQSLFWKHLVFCDRLTLENSRMDLFPVEVLLRLYWHWTVVCSMWSIMLPLFQFTIRRFRQRLISICKRQISLIISRCLTRRQVFLPFIPRILVDNVQRLGHLVLANALDDIIKLFLLLQPLLHRLRQNGPGTLHEGIYVSVQLLQTQVARCTVW